MIKIAEDNECCGCHACSSVCPKNCIQMIENEEGFLYPDVDHHKCIHCNLCQKVCPMLHQEHSSEYKTRAYLVQNIDSELREESTSGGLFSLLGQYVLEKNGTVFGARFDKELGVYHDYIEDVHDLKYFRNSKYVQSNMNTSYTKVKQLLEEGRWVCFSGTPCQIQGLSLFLGKKYERLILVDFICRGVPSPKLLKNYIHFNEAKFKDKIEYIRFRDKKFGYNFGSIQLIFQSGRIKNEGPTTDLYLRSFFKGCSSRMSCFKCPMKYEDRISDFTLFDSWNVDRFFPDMDDDLGTTNVLIHSEKAMNILNSIQGRARVADVSVKEVINFDGDMLLEQPEMNIGRRYFLKDIDSKSIKEQVERYIPISKIEIIRKYLKPLSCSLGINRIFIKLKRRKKVRK
ncbi:Coenzyme F420 hydrogenase/dehydrogenase, beta subunit C-terminal domain [Anaerostipes caccae]|uniref:Coenzyme F420 hydrogenase/dehydrogenase, beta subunit C-terminal domain n=1 Tax=Anaerostipes caccae TaxID=105841 RepID=UPI00101C68B1|nr:Coenzyme F420 hydrogenase/dehydrogenase, beta subunit C-terminal domain [Anaerostipes caccae]